MCVISQLCSFKPILLLPPMIGCSFSYLRTISLVKLFMHASSRFQCCHICKYCSVYLLVVEYALNEGSCIGIQFHDRPRVILFLHFKLFCRDFPEYTVCFEFEQLLHSSWNYTFLKNIIHRRTQTAESHMHKSDLAALHSLY